MKNFDTIFGDVRENAIAAAAAVSKQAAKLYDASKHRISAENIKREIGKKLIELGKLTYKATTQNTDLSEDIAKVVQEITELKQSLALVNAQIASIKNQKICPVCEKYVTSNSVFCNYCGYKFEEEPVEEEAAETAETEEAVADVEVTAEAAAEETAEEPAAETEEAPAPAAEPDEIVVAAQEAVEEIAVGDEEETLAELEKAAAEEEA